MSSGSDGGRDGARLETGGGACLKPSGSRRVANTGLPPFGDLFTPRQLVALTTFSDLVGEAMERVRHDAAASLPDDGKPLRDGGTGAKAYAEAVGVYLGFAREQGGELSELRSLCVGAEIGSRSEGLSETGIPYGVGLRRNQSVR